MKPFLQILLGAGREPLQGEEPGRHYLSEGLHPHPGSLPHPPEGARGTCGDHGLPSKPNGEEDCRMFCRHAIKTLLQTV